MRRLVPVALVLLACDPMEIDPSLSGVFPCERTAECPPMQTCVMATCWAETPPRISIVSPEQEVAFPLTAQPFIEVVVKIDGSDLELVESRDDPFVEFGKGSIAVLVDGDEQEVLTSGDLEGGITLQVQVDAVAGPHRIRAVARNSAGVRYDNAEAEGRRLFWIDDGAPHVAFFNPFPGDTFPLEAEEIAVGVAALNFTLARPDGDVTEPERIGHAHVHYDERFPECTFDPVCDGDQLGMVAPSSPSSIAESTVGLPPSAAGEASLAAVLRNGDHFAYFWPPWTAEIVWDEITIRRAPAD